MSQSALAAAHRFGAAFLLVGMLVACANCCPLTAAERQVDFIKDVHPIFAAHCYRCHGPDDQESSFRLDSRDTAFAGGDFGEPAIVAGSAEESPLYEYVSNRDGSGVAMPPDEQLSAHQVEILKRWINEGANWPESSDAEDLQASRMHWAFQPLSTAQAPKVKHDEWVQTPMDLFLVSGYERAGITPNAIADKRTLLRRVTFDLIGLPPTPSEMETFLADSTEHAFVRVVERLLDSPHYGEKWGRHWMDVVRYADTAGDSSDFPIPDMFRYRNYIIRSFNEGKPYDRFVREQLAGDLLPAKTTAQRNRQVIATGYLASAMRFGNAGPEPYLTIEDTINNLGQGLLALTIQCARCHDHKFDPISARDYYALYGIFESTRYPHPGHEMDRAPVNFVPLIPRSELEAILAPYEAQLETLRAPFGPLYRELEQAKKSENRSRDETSAAEQTAGRTPHEIEQDIQQVAIAYSAAAADYPVFPKAYAVLDATPVDAKLQIKGEPRQLGDEVPRGFLEVLGGQTLPSNAVGSGRLQLANWILEHPLAARVIVNRLWHWHFGRGLSPSVNDLGVRGQPPSHPELLDYLARKLIDGGWSIKDLQREIVHSRTYQLATSDSTDARREDPENRLWWRFARRRLEAEEIRDTMLYISGELDPSMPEEPHPFPPRGTWRYSQHEPFEDVYDTRHRSVYLMTKRQRRHPLMTVFDGADTTASTGTRMASTTPLQALYLYNDEFVHARASAFAARLQRREASEESRIDLAYRLAFGRLPSPLEVRAGRQFLSRSREILKSRHPQDDELTLSSWAAFARVLFRTNEFVYVD